jgi:flagellar motor switch protein FliN
MSDSAMVETSSSSTLDDDSRSRLSAHGALGGTFSGSGPSEFHNTDAHNGEAVPSPSQQDMNLVMDIPVSLSVELGRTKVPIKQLLQLAQGSVIELEAMAGDPMDVYVNGCLIARGEVVVTKEKFGIRLTDIVTPAERIQRIKKK